MKILRGFVKDVINKGTEEKPWCYVGIEAISKDRDGFDQTELVKFMVAGNQFKEGLQNAYRVLIGTEVFAPYSDEIDYFNNKVRIPRSSGHPFHEHLTTDSTVIRPPIPRASGH